MIAWLKREMVEVGLVTLYFLGCFLVAVALLNLALAQRQLEFRGLTEAVIIALVLAKVVVVMGKTRAGTRFDARVPVAVAAAYKSLLYFAATFGVLLAEKIFHAYREHDALGAAIVAVWTNRNRDVILVKSLCIALALIGYHLYAGVDRRLGKGILWRVMWKRAATS